MASKDFTFGVEIETGIPNATAPQVGRYHAGIQIPDLPEGWKAECDGSIRGFTNCTAAEIVSPVLKGAEGMAALKQVCHWLKSVGAKVNKSCGLHVHVGFNKGDPEQLKKVVGVVANFEKAIYASTGTKSREQGMHCCSVQNSEAHKNGRLNNCGRYHVLNVATRYPTVEFRAFAGTTNFNKIVSHVLTCIGLVEKSMAIKRLPAWTAKEVKNSWGPIHRGGEGLTALNRLFYWLGWTKGREVRTFGWFEGCPKITTIKDTLVRLAKKYDGPVGRLRAPDPRRASSMTTVDSVLDGIEREQRAAAQSPVLVPGAAVIGTPRPEYIMPF